MQKKKFVFLSAFLGIFMALAFLGCSGNVDPGSGSGSDVGTNDVDPPTVPGNVEAEAVDSSSILVSWDSVSDADSYIVYYRSISNNDSYRITGSEVSVTSTSNSKLISDLDSSEFYIFWVKSKNSGGLSDYSDWTWAQTESSSGGSTSRPSTPTILGAQAIDSSSIEVWWSSISQATSYIVFYREDEGSYEDWTITGYESTVIVTSNEAVITGLDANTTYYFWVKAKNSNGTSNYSTFEEATTKSGSSQSGRISPPSRVFVEKYNSTTVTVSWPEVAGATKYQVMYALGTDGELNYSSWTSNTSININGLSPYHTWYFYVRASNGSTTSDWSSNYKAFYLEPDW